MPKWVAFFTLHIGKETVVLAATQTTSRKQPPPSQKAPGSCTLEAHPATILQLPVRACERACVNHGMGLLVEIYRGVAGESEERRRGERRAGMQTDSKQVRLKRRKMRVHKEEEEVEDEKMKKKIV